MNSKVVGCQSNDHAKGFKKSDRLPSPIKQEVNDLETIDKFQCRTCLKSTKATSCTAINQNFFSNKTAKEVIVLLVPEMDSKLKDDEMVCDDCLEVLKSTMQFIEKCLEVEAFLTKKEQNEKDAVVLETCKVEMEEPQENVVVDVEPDYCLSDEAEGTKNGGENEIHARIDYEDVPIAIETLPQCYEKDMEEPELNKADTPPSNTKLVIKPLNTKNKPTLSCSTCLECFATKEEYKNHLEIHPPHSCDVCGKAFKSRGSLWGHKFTHNERSFICEVCGKGFKDRSTLHHHVKRHTGDRSYECDNCSEVFETKRALNNHVNYVHDKMSGIQCMMCGIMYRDNSSLQTHMKVVHFKEKPFECNICQRRFGKADYLDKHRLTHAGVRRPSSTPKSEDRKLRQSVRMQYNTQFLEELLPCKFCGEKCKGVPVLRRHLKLHLKRYPCKFCSLTFISNPRLKRHEETHQGGTVNFVRCNVCWKKFKTKEELDKHAALHDKPRHSCDSCGETFNRKFLLNQHKLMEHSNIPDIEQIDSIIHETLLGAGVLST